MAQEPNFLDAHTHVQFSAFTVDRDVVLARARETGVVVVNVGTQQDTSRTAVELAEKSGDGVFATIGLHPVHTSKSFHDIDELGDGEAAKSFVSRGEIFDPDFYRKLAASPKVVAIGECGLDYFRFDTDDSQENQIKKQKDAFIAQIELALEIKKPLMIHCRNAFADLIDILKNYEKQFSEKLNGVPGVVHFFTGTPDDAKSLAALGFAFTFGGAVTFPPRRGKTAGDYDEVIKSIPLDRILSETDAPYVAPAAYRGKRNEPAYVIEVVKKLAELKSVSPEEMKAQIWENAKRVFKI